MKSKLVYFFAGALVALISSAATRALDATAAAPKIKKGTHGRPGQEGRQPPNTSSVIIGLPDGTARGSSYMMGISIKQPGEKPTNVGSFHDVAPWPVLADTSTWTTRTEKEIQALQAKGLKRDANGAPIPVARPAGAPAATIWLDRPLTTWNQTAGRDGLLLARSAATFRVRCHLKDLGTSAGQHAVSQSGRIAFLPFDRDNGLIHGDIEIVGGMSDATEDCAPASFNFFVFVGGVYAGTLSPVDMTTGKDGVIGFVRFPPGDVITAEFARYVATDSECCPSGRVRVTYKIDRQTGRAVVIPTEIRTIRQVPR